MTVKEYLLRGRKLNDEVEQLKYARRQALELACGASVGYDVEKVQTSQVNTVEKKFIAYADYSKLLDEKIDELSDYRAKMLKLINKLENTTYRTLLIARYINCKTWELIAEEMSYSDVWVRTRLHSDALQELEKYYIVTERLT